MVPSDFRQEETKDSIRKKRKRKSDIATEPSDLPSQATKGTKLSRKRVSFA